MDERLAVRSAGLDKDAQNTLSSDDIKWADVIFVMENTHRNKLSKKFSSYLKSKRVICLNIPDEYEFMDSELIDILKTKVTAHLGTY